jgi:hypothetical protein
LPLLSGKIELLPCCIAKCLLGTSTLIQDLRIRNAGMPFLLSGKLLL